MASNKHYEIDLRCIESDEEIAPNFDEIIRIADLPNIQNPFGNILKRDKYVNNSGDKWLFDEIISNFNYQESGYENEVSKFYLKITFDTALALSEIDQDRFLYSIARHLSHGRWRNRRQGVGSFFQLGKVEEGSIRANLYAGVVGVGALVANYPDLKHGFQEMLNDAHFIKEKISTAVRAAKLPEPKDGGKNHEPHLILNNEKSRRKSQNEKFRVLRDD